MKCGINCLLNQPIREEDLRMALTVGGPKIVDVILEHSITSKFTWQRYGKAESLMAIYKLTVTGGRLDRQTGRNNYRGTSSPQKQIFW